ncbi:MAG: precorrin-8X methylmutase, partial [Desulfonatronovibrionaceae bacterium]
MMNRQAIIILAHGSRNVQARKSFLNMVETVGRRTQAKVAAAFFSLGEPDLAQSVDSLARAGADEITIFPFFLFDGSHVRHDIPALVKGLEEKHPGILFRVLNSLEHEPLMPEIILERIWEYSGYPRYQPGEDIEAASLDFIRNMLGQWPDRAGREIAARVVHASADFSLGRCLKFHAEAIKAGQQALKEDKQIVCDVSMVRSALTGCSNVLCAVDQPDAASRAKARGITRAAAGMEILAEHLNGAVAVVGNAPTALWKILDLADEGIVPDLVIGVPVGFVGAAQSKQALMHSRLT